MDKDLGVIFHELCHILYQNQAADIQQHQERLFLSHPSPYKILAYQILDEALATALGQGWYYQQLNGALDLDIWYAVEQIDKVSKTIYMLVEEYVDASKTLDTVFVNRYLQLYENEFAESLFEVQSNISNVNLLIDESFANPNVLFPYFFQHFNMRSIQHFNPIDEQHFYDWQNKLGTKMIILDKKANSNYFIKNKLEWLPLNNKIKDTLYTNIVNGEQYYILMVSDFESIGKIFELLSKRKKIYPTFEVIEMND